MARYKGRQSARAIVCKAVSGFSTVGGFVPALWGADLLSFSAILFSGIGALVGLFVAYKLA